MIQSQLNTILEDRTIAHDEFASMTGINLNTLKPLITGQAKSITFDDLNTITRTLDVELNDLFLVTPDLDLEVSLTNVDETTKNFNGTLHFIDNDQSIVTDLPLTGHYHQSGPLFTFTINDAYDVELEADGIAERLNDLQPTPLMTPTKRHLLNLLAQHPEQQAWFEPEGMPLSDKPTDVELERYLQVGNLIARTQYEKLHRLLEPLAMTFLAALYHDFPKFLGDPQVIAVPWGIPDTFHIFNFILAESPESLTNNGITKRQEQARQQSAFPVSYTSLDVISYFSND
ncbi:XRE family transcriptional regulator [Lactiplantibacillus garii]|uniref:XRE family transcriptional regulator n=1 Tax=Lactiplantibacillus garii TaxID=2306423 RepID=A0A3R8L2A0_9LACO|nr:helix-turn-helix transcriptional regulator [Lactiplantibacillus garii]RRK11007.1 XRE family transcriptional regulator [Lactiplantibacillus garii]